MVTVFERAYGKINLTLDVLGKREDGYHDLKSVMQTVSLCDDVEMDIGTGREWEVSCGREGIPNDERNLAWKAAKVFFDATRLDPDGLTIRITKRIPSGAGMGGGSADAAAVLRALNRQYGEPFSLTALADLGAKVGSDVPFCVLQGTAMAEGRGEILRSLPEMPGCVLVLCKPDFSVSTPVLFRKLDAVPIGKHPDNDAMEAALIRSDLTAIAENVYNVFEPVVASDHPEIDHIKSIMDGFGALVSQMTGSGSVVFAIMPDRHHAEAAANKLKENCYQVFLAEPV